MVFKSLVLAFLSVSAVYIEKQLDSVMTLGWDIDLVAQEISITLKCKITKGYCSVGLTSSMKNTDMFAALTDSQTVTVQDYWSRSHATPLTDIAEGGTSDYIMLSSSINSTGLIAVLKRKLKTGDKYDQDIIPDVQSYICWAYIDRKIGWVEHSDFSSAKFTWASNITASTLQPSGTGGESGDDTTENHGKLMSVAWACSATIGISTARYFKNHWWWFYVHLVFMLFTSLATIITSANMYIEDSRAYSGLDDSLFLHSRLGMILSSLVISQVVFGMMISYFKIFTKNTQVLILLLRAHKTVGYAMFIAGLFNCYKGWDLYEDSGRAWIILGFILTALLFGLLEAIQIFYWNKSKSAKKDLPQMTHFKALSLVEEGKLIMFSDDLVVDVTHFVVSHPGGSFMIKECIGEDTGKYMVGCSSYGSNYNPYVHSDAANSILRSLSIGKIQFPTGYLNLKGNNDSTEMKFIVSDKKTLNQSTLQIYLKSDSFSMSKFCESPAWLGKHFKVSYTNKKETVSRYYSSIFVDVLDWASELGLCTSASSHHEDGEVKFIFKVYPQGKMSNHLNKLKVGESLTIQGPFGPGLLLQDLAGRFVAIAGGTGLVPFLDLIYFAFRKFGNKCDHLKISIFVFFRSFKDAFAHDILDYIKSNSNWLDYRLLSDVDSDVNGMRDDICRRVKEGADKVWICGPSGFNRFYKNLVLDSGLNGNKLVLM